MQEMIDECPPRFLKYVFGLEFERQCDYRSPASLPTASLQLKLYPQILPIYFFSVRRNKTTFAKSSSIKELLTSTDGV